MADGEIEVSVQADGVDDAAGELSGDGGGGGGEAAAAGGGAAGGGRSFQIGKLLTKLATLLVFLGPILDVLGVISGIMEAFMAPVAVMLLRLLQPLIRLMLWILPYYLDFMEYINDGLDLLMNPLSLLSLLVTGIFKVVNWIDGLDFSSWFENLPQNLADALISALPGFDSNPTSQGGGDTPGLIDILGDAVNDTVGPTPFPPVNIAINGGIDAFVETVTNDQNVSLP